MERTKHRSAWLGLTLSICIFVSPLQSFSQWPIGSQKMVSDFNERVSHDDSTWAAIVQFIGWDNPYFASVWDVVGTRIFVKINRWARWYRSNSTPISQAQTIMIPTTHSRFGNDPGAGSTPARVLWRYNRNGQIVKAPLLLYNPGLFQSDDAPSTVSAMELLSHLGFHVLVISNPFSPAYGQYHPRVAVGSFVNEATVLKEALQGFVAQNRVVLEKVHVLGSSYGGFLSTILAALDAEDEKLIDGTVTLIGPQLDVYKSQTLLDRLIDESQSSFSTRIFEGAVGGHLHSGLVAAHVTSLQTYAYFRANGFQQRQYSADVIKVYDYLLRLKSKSSQWRAWQASMRFLSSLRTYTPENVATFQGPAGKLETWLVRAKQAGQNQIRFLTACDDFTSECDWWKSLPEEWRQPEHFLIRVTGSHNGFVATGWFDEFMRITYTDPQNLNAASFVE